MLYLAVARTGSESLNVAIGKRGAPHTHACTLPLLQREAMTTKRFGMSNEPFRVLISLRSPLERISSGVQRRSDRLNHTHQKPANQLFIRHFGWQGPRAWHPSVDQSLHLPERTALAVEEGARTHERSTQQARRGGSVVQFSERPGGSALAARAHRPAKVHQRQFVSWSSRVRDECATPLTRAHMAQISQQ